MVLFFFYFPIKVGGVTFIIARENPRPPALRTSGRKGPNFVEFLATRSTMYWEICLKKFQHLTQQMHQRLFNLNRSHNFNFSFTLHVAGVCKTCRGTSKGSVDAVILVTQTCDKTTVPYPSSAFLLLKTHLSTLSQHPSL